MASLFQGTPQSATSYSESTSETPKWMQDAIFNQVNWSQNIANKPYEPYEFQTVADLDPYETQAFQGVKDAQGAWKQDMSTAQAGMEGMQSAGTAGNLGTAQQQYLRQDLVNQNLDAGQNLFNQAGNLDIVGAGQGYLNQAAGMNASTAANPYLNQANATTAQALSDRALTAANPYLNQASQSSASDVSSYMNPYQTNVMDVLAQQGARNLSENLLPAVSDSFIKAGQFGSRNMGEFGSRALRDTQEAVLQQQANAQQQGYSQALQSSAADKQRQASLAGTVGSISGADLSRVLQGGSQYANLGSTAGQLMGQDASRLASVGQNLGQLTGQQMSQLGNLGNMRTSAGAQQQQMQAGAAQAFQNAEAQDLQRQIGAMQTSADMAIAAQGANYRDLTALEAAGRAVRQQDQQVLSAAEKQDLDRKLYPQRQLDFLGTQVRGMAPITPVRTTTSGATTGATYNPSPLTQAATGLATYNALKPRDK